MYCKIFTVGHNLVKDQNGALYVEEKCQLRASRNAPERGGEVGFEVLTATIKKISLPLTTSCRVVFCLRRRY